MPAFPLCLADTQTSAFRPDGISPGAPGHCLAHYFSRQPVSTWRHDAL